MIMKKNTGGTLTILDKHIFVDNTARDAYFVLHPTELVDGLTIQVGSDFEKYQTSTTTFNSITAITRGQNGLAGSIQVGTVTTLPAGSSATVLNIGTTNSAIFDFGIPKGADGADGGLATWGGITGTLSAQTDLNSALNGKQVTLVSGTNIKTINGTSVLGSGNIVISGGAGAVDSVNTKTGVVTLNQDEIPDGTTYKQYSQTEKTKLSNITGTNTGDETTSTIKTKLGAGSTSTDGYITSTDWNTFNGKQANLVSGTNIKTINGASVLGSGDIVVSGGAGVTVYADLATIKAIDTTAYTDVQTVQVTTLGLYRFQPVSTLTGDDLNVITPTIGSGRWIKQSIDLTEQTINVISGTTITGTENINQNSLKEKGEILIPKKTRFNKARKVVFFGSSVCGGFAITNYADSYAGKITTALTAETDITYSFKNISVGGDTTQLVLDRFKDVISENPDLVVIGLSSNNEQLYLQIFNPVAANIAILYKKRLEKIVSLCEQYGFKYMIMGEYAADGSTDIGWNAKKQLNHELTKIYGDKYINWLGQLANSTGAFKAVSVKYNGTHPNEAGHLKLFENINLNCFNLNKTPFKPFVYWGGKCKCTVAGSYVARSLGHDVLNNYTFTFETSKGTGGNNVTLWGSNHTLQIRVDANGFIAIYENSALKTTTTVAPVANKKNKIVIVRDLTLALIKILIDDVEVSSFTPTNSSTLSQFFIANDGSTSGTTAVGWEFANLVLYRGVIDTGGINQIFKNDYPQSVIEFANSMNINGANEFILYSESSGNGYMQLATTQSWAVSDYTNNNYTDTEKTKLANSISGTFTTNDGKTITVVGGMITSIV